MKQARKPWVQPRWHRYTEYGLFYLLAGFVLLSGFTAVWGRGLISGDIYPF